MLPLSRREILRSILAAVANRVVPSVGSANLEPTLIRVAIPVRGLDRRLDGLRIGQISDAHIGAALGLDHLERAAALLLRQPPDVLVVTGDLVDDAALTTACLDAVSRIRAPLGRYFILGNHENYAGRDDVMAVAQRHEGVRFLCDSLHGFTVDGARVQVAGLDYDIRHEVRVRRWRMGMLPRLAWRRTFPDMKDRVAQLTDRLGAADFRLALAHHPDFFDETAPAGMDLTLSGHTHGGQVAPLGTLMAHDAFDYVKGHYRHGDRHLYVNGGTGHWLPLRVGVPAEVTELTLQRV